MSSDYHYSQDRCELIKMYPGDNWAKKVMKMSDQQVYATLVSIRNRREKKEKELHNSAQKCAQICVNS